MAELELKEVSYFYESGGKRIDILDKDADFGGCAGRT